MQLTNQNSEMPKAICPQSLGPKVSKKDAGKVGRKVRQHDRQTTTTTHEKGTRNVFVAAKKRIVAVVAATLRRRQT